MTKISGDNLRASLLNRLAGPRAMNREAERIEVLAGARTRELLVAIAQFRPRSISELSAIVERHQPNVSRGLNALVRTGLVTLEADGRASVPTPTEDGLRKAAELAESVDLSDFAPPEENEDDKVTRLLKIETSTRPGDLQTDAVLGRLVLFGQHRSDEGVDLNELSVRLLKNWWRIFCRYDDPFRLCTLTIRANEETRAGPLLLKALGSHMQLYVRRSESIDPADNLFSTDLSERSAEEILLDRVVRPVAAYLERGRRFDRPIHSLLSRLEDVMSSKRERAFARTAGGLGLSLHDMSDACADAITRLIDALPDESARLEFASSTLPEAFEENLAWAHGELKARQETNRFDGLRGWKTRLKVRREWGWPAGKARAEELRRLLKLGDDQAIGGVEGLCRRFGAEDFTASAMSDDPLRGYRGRKNEAPVMVVRESGHAGTAFLLARAIGDYLAYDDREAPISELFTDRQAMGRAFAAELLAPAEGVINMIQEGQTQMAVARHYGVDLPVVRHQYSNHV
ncbi:ArsR family transcriptional regulator [Phenylobacterium kunshanense]|nr:ArsR family transcriptional regulator [Phenylobacterium kunshanense]